jgi:hypothetical protein
MRLIRTLLFVLAAAFCSFGIAPALAQGCGASNPNCVVPDRASGDNTSAAANTRFVKAAIAALPSSALDAICATNNDTLIRLTGTWQCAGYSAQFSVGSTISIASLSWSLITGTPTTLAGYGITNARTQLTGNINYYVNGSSSGTAACGPAGGSTCSIGSDSGNCLTVSTACLTLQHVLNVIVSNIDFAQAYTASIYLAHNTGTANYSASCGVGPFIGTSVISVTGDSTSQTSTVIVPPASGYGLQVKDLCTISYSYVEFADNATNNGAGHIIVGETGNAGHVDLNNVTFGPMTIGTMLNAGNMGSISVTGPGIVIAGAGCTGGVLCPVVLEAENGGLIDFASQTVTVTGTPAIGTGFAYMTGGGVIGATSSTFSGSATGPRCLIDGPLNVGGYDPNAVFPGNANCVQNEYVGAIGIQNGSTFGYGSAGQALISGGGSGTKDSWGTLGYAGGGTNATSLAGAQANFEMEAVKVSATGVNFNAVADTALPFTLPSGYTRVYLAYVTISNASHTLTTAQFGVFTAASAGGAALIASGTAITVSATADQTNNNVEQIGGLLTLSSVAASLVTPNTIYFRVTNGEGTTATADVTAVLMLAP